MQEFSKRAGIDEVDRALTRALLLILKLPSQARAHYAVTKSAIGLQLTELEWRKSLSTSEQSLVLGNASEKQEGSM